MGGFWDHIDRMVSSPNIEDHLTAAMVSSLAAQAAIELLMPMDGVMSKVMAQVYAGKMDQTICNMARESGFQIPGPKAGLSADQIVELLTRECSCPACNAG